MDTTAMQVFKAIKPIESMLESREVMVRFAKALGMEDARPYISSVLQVVMRSRDLRVCEPESILFAALDAATLRLSVIPQLGHAYLVPFKDHGLPKATMIVGYKGMKQMAIRTGLYASLDSLPIFQGESVDFDRMSGWGEPTGKATDLTKIVGRLAYFKMNDGYKKALYMTTADIHAWALKYSKGYNHPDSSWKKPWMVGAMEAKTPFRILMEHDGYMDPFEMAFSRREDAGVVDGVAVDIPGPTPVPSPSGRTQLGEGGMRPTPNENGEGGIRTPEQVKAGLVQKAGELAMRNRTMATAADRALVATKLNECFAGDPMADKKRHDVLLYLTGYATVPNLPPTTVRALIEWLVLGECTLRESAREEARGVWKRTEDEGQRSGG